MHVKIARTCVLARVYRLMPYSEASSPLNPTALCHLRLEVHRIGHSDGAITSFQNFPNSRRKSNCVARLAPSGLSNIYARTLMTAMASRTTRSTHSCCNKGRSSSSKHAVTLTRANRGLPSVRALT